jgi:hypothetical protein
MNGPADADLLARLRALCVPPPDNGFELRLLRRLEAEPAPAPARSAAVVVLARWLRKRRVVVALAAAALRPRAATFRGLAVPQPAPPARPLSRSSSGQLREWPRQQLPARRCSEGSRPLQVQARRGKQLRPSSVSSRRMSLGRNRAAAGAVPSPIGPVCVPTRASLGAGRSGPRTVTRPSRAPAAQLCSCRSGQTRRARAAWSDCGSA